MDVAISTPLTVPTHPFKQSFSEQQLHIRGTVDDPLAIQDKFHLNDQIQVNAEQAARLTRVAGRMCWRPGCHNRVHRWSDRCTQVEPPDGTPQCGSCKNFFTCSVHVHSRTGPHRNADIIRARLAGSSATPIAAPAAAAPPAPPGGGGGGRGGRGRGAPLGRAPVPQPQGPLRQPRPQRQEEERLQAEVARVAAGRARVRAAEAEAVRVEVARVEAARR